MSKITDAQVEVAEGAYWAVLRIGFHPDAREREIAAMRAALEAYERVRDLAAIYGKTDVETEQQERQL